MKTLITAIAMTALLSATAAFADDQAAAKQTTENQASQLVAFQNLESAPVSAGEMDTAGAWMIRWGSFCVSSNDACK